ARGCCTCRRTACFFSSRRRHTRFSRDWSSDVCSSDLGNPYRHPLRPEERVRLILAYLLQDAQNTRVRVQDLADRLGVSRGTLLSDLKTVEEKLAAYRIRLLRIPGYGLKLDADEFRWRQAAASLVFSELDPEHPDRSFRLAEAPKLSAPETVPSMASLLPRELMATIEAVLSGFDWEP